VADLSIVPVQPWHAEYVAAHLREADRAEVWALNRMTPELAVQRSLRAPGDAWVALIDEEPAALFGIASSSIVADEATVWMLATPILDRNARLFLHETPKLLAEMHSRWPRLVNTVHIDNRRTIRWLTWLGAVFDVHGNQVRFELCAR
jgi:hypothetical protein